MITTTIEVQERNDPLVTLWVLTRTTDQTLVPYDFTGAAVEFYQKADSSDADGLPLYTVANGLITVLPAPPWDLNGSPIVDRTEKNRLAIQMSAANLATPGNKFYRIDTVQASKRITVARGSLVVGNV